MNPLVKELWLKALRSGDYQQTKGYLHKEGSIYADSNGYCCLGVLSDVACKSGEVDIERRWQKVVDSRFEFFGDGSSYLDSRVAKWAGLGWDQENKLVELNDGGSTFPQIAEYIQEHL